MTKQVTVFGASGNVGRRVVAELLRRNYAVVAFVHSSATFTADSHLKIVHGDIYDAAAVDAAIEGSTAIVSALGSWGTPKKDILTVGISHIIDSMQRHGVTRIVSLTGAEARVDGDSIGLVHRTAHLVLGIIAGKVLVDGERHIALLVHSHLDWTVIRSPIMSPSDLGSARYVLSMKRPLPWARIRRHLVVASMVNALEDQHWLRQAPFIWQDK